LESGAGVIAKEVADTRSIITRIVEVLAVGTIKVGTIKVGTIKVETIKVEIIKATQFRIKAITLAVTVQKVPS